MPKSIDVKFRPKKDPKSSQQDAVSVRIFVSEPNLGALAAAQGDPCLIEGPNGARREAELWADKQLTGAPGAEPSPAKISSGFLEVCGFSLSEVYRISPLPGPVAEADEVSLVDQTGGESLTYPEKWIGVLEIRLDGE